MFQFGMCSDCCGSSCVATIGFEETCPEICPESLGCYMVAERLSDGQIFSARVTNTTVPSLFYPGFCDSIGSLIVLSGHNNIVSDYNVYFSGCSNSLPSTGVLISGCQTPSLSVHNPWVFNISGHVSACPSYLGLPGATVNVKIERIRCQFFNCVVQESLYNNTFTTDSNGNFTDEFILNTGIAPSFYHSQSFSATDLRITYSGVSYPAPYVPLGPSILEQTLSCNNNINLSLASDMESGWYCACGGPVPPNLCYSDGCTSFEIDTDFRSKTILCGEAYSNINPYNICQSIGGPSTIFLFFRRVDFIPAWSFASNEYECSIEIDKYACAGCVTRGPGYPADLCDFTYHAGSGACSDDFADVGSIGNADLSGVVWGPLGTMPNVSITWEIPQRIFDVLGGGHWECPLSNYPSHLYSTATIGPCGNQLTINTQGSPPIDTWVNIYNSGESIVIASGSTGSNGTRSWLITSGSSPWYAEIAGTDCYEAASGLVYSGINTFTLSVGTGCVKYDSPCMLCSGRAYSKTLYLSDDFGSRTLEWLGDSGWYSSDYKYHAYCSSGWALYADTPSGILNYYEASGTISVDCDPLVLSISEGFYDATLTE